MRPGSYDFEVVRGTTFPVLLRLSVIRTDGTKVPLAGLEGATVLLKIDRKAGGALVKTMEVDPAAAEVSTELTVAETRSLPVGRRTPYEVEVRTAAGKSSVYLAGYFNGLGGVNDD